MGKLLSEKEVEQTYGISRRWLQKMRWAGGGPPYVKLGRSVRYREVDIDNFIEGCMKSSTSDH